MQTPIGQSRLLYALLITSQADLIMRTHCNGPFTTLPLIFNQNSTRIHLRRAILHQQNNAVSASSDTPDPFFTQQQNSQRWVAMAFSGLTLAVLLLSLISHARSCTEEEKNSLLQFLAGLSRDGGLAVLWRNGTTDCCSWEGISCNESGAVVEVVLAERGLQGHVLPALGDLTGLLRLNLSHNSLSGGLPLDHLMSSSSIVVVDVSFNRLQGELLEVSSSATHGSPLQVLNISSNMFTGEFPSTTWRSMKNLVALNTSNNSFRGQVPASFCLASASFTMLDLGYNQFTGSIPPDLGDCSMITVLKLDHSSLNGTIPDELFNAILLEHLSLRNAGLRGTLDGAHLAKLSGLITLDLGENQLTGKFPDSIGQLKRLEELHLDYNNMSGELPSALCNCTNLITIDLKSNYFSGELSKVNFSTLQNLERLDLGSNKFIGMVPESIYSCTNLTALRLAHSKFYGELSPKIGTLKALTLLSLFNNSFINITNSLQILKSSKNLRYLFLGKNFIHEAMPQDKTIDGFDNLQVVAMGQCSLTGKIPLWLSNLRNLEFLSLANNRLDGQIPGWINHLNNLSYLDVSNNSLTGEIRTAFLAMKTPNSNTIATHSDRSFFPLPICLTLSRQYRLTLAFPKKLDLSNNDFTGVIPQDIGQLKGLHILNLSFNRFYGQIPQALSGLTDLLVLDLSSNLLNGTIPIELNHLHFLSMFNVSNNDLEGSVPAEGQLSTFPDSSFNGNPKLCSFNLVHHCNPVEATPDSIITTKDCSDKVVFVISFAASFGIAVLYDQLVISTFH